MTTTTSPTFLYKRESRKLIGGRNNDHGPYSIVVDGLVDNNSFSNNLYLSANDETSLYAILSIIFTNVLSPRGT